VRSKLKRAPWIVGRAVNLVVALPVTGAERQVGLTEDDRAGRLQSLYHHDAGRQTTSVRRLYGSRYLLRRRAYPAAATLKLSLTVIGRPRSGWLSPLASATSAAAAASRARSKSRTTLAACSQGGQAPYAPYSHQDRNNRSGDMM
jgi:hypothetical protein